MNFRNLLDRYHSIEPKIFVIGFNKSGTKSLHHFFEANGIASLHNRLPKDENGERLNAALIMAENRAKKRRILNGLWQFQAFSDLIALTDDHVVEANAFFRDFHRQHRRAYFIFNDRPVDDWIESRLNHDGGPGGSFVERYQAAMNMSRAEVIEFWRKNYKEHKDAVLAYFGDSPRFMLFDITRDGPEQLTRFLSADFSLDPEHWQHRGSRAERLAEQERKQG